MEIAHEIRMAREAEASMDLHVAKAGEVAQREMAKHKPYHQDHIKPNATGTNYINDPTSTTMTRGNLE